MNSLLRLNSVSLMRAISRGHIRLISTEQAKNAPTTPETVGKVELQKDFTKESVQKSKNWVSYGWDHYDKKEDRARMRTTFFLTITLGMVVCGTVLAYEPDRRLRSWSQREAFLRLRDRELAGLDPIDPNYYDPATITLPSEEELEGIEIII